MRRVNNPIRATHIIMVILPAITPTIYIFSTVTDTAVLAKNILQVVRGLILAHTLTLILAPDLIQAGLILVLTLVLAHILVVPDRHPVLLLDPEQERVLARHQHLVAMAAQATMAAITAMIMPVITNKNPYSV